MQGFSNGKNVIATIKYYWKPIQTKFIGGGLSIPTGKGLNKNW
jgi:hypothetical protein